MLAIEKREEKPVKSGQGFFEIYAPQIGEAIPKIVGFIDWYLKERSRVNLKITYIFVVLLGLLALGVFILSLIGKISGDVVVFVFGSLIGYIFAFLQRYLGPGEG